MSYTFQFRDVFAAHDQLLAGLLVTLQLTGVTVAVGFALGLAAAVARVYGPPILRRAAGAYIEAIRNTPLLVQLYVIFFGLPSVGLKLDAITASLIGLTINLGAYTAEIVRAGFESVPKSQVEAGASLGLTGPQVFRYVVLVPSLKAIYPSLASQFVLLMLATSVVSQISAPDLFHAGSIVQSRTYRDFEVITVIATLYLALALVLRGAFAVCAHLLFRRR